MIFPALLLWLAAPLSADPLEEALRKVAAVFAIVEREAADPVTPQRLLYEGALPGMLRQLDPHSVFFDPGQFDQLKQMEQSIQKGFGSVVSVLPGRVIVLQTLPNTPSSRAGLAPGDEILAVNNVPFAGLEMEQLIGVLGQSRQGKAKLDVRKPGNSRLMQFILTPESMESPSVERAFLLEPGVAYLRVSSFDGKTGVQVREAIEKLGGKQLQSLVLDLRNNPGGVMEAALETAALFLQPGQRIVSVRGKGQGQAKEIDVPPGMQPYTFPVAVLMNEKSASASEIVAGALQDHDRGIVLGVPSFGKGLVQAVFPLSDNTGVALTTAFYYTPSGRSIQKPLRGGQLDSVTAAVPSAPTFQTDQGRTVRGGGGIQPDHVMEPEGYSRLQAVLEGTASFAAFATEVTRKQTITPDFQVPPIMLDDFRVFLSSRNIQPSLAEWAVQRDWVRSRVQQEILNQALGVDKGDEVEARRDPQVRKAMELLRSGAK